MRMILALALMLAACSKSSDVLEELPNSSLAGAPRDEVPDTRLESHLVRPVTIGEDGPRLDACGAMGQAVRVGARGASHTSGVSVALTRKACATIAASWRRAE